MGASDLLRLKQRDPDAYRAELARIERQRLGASDADNVGVGPPAFGLPRMRSFEALMAAFQAQASGEIGAVRAAKLSDIKRGLIYACTGLRATMLSGLPLRLYRMDAKATGRKLDLADPLSRMGKPAMVRGQRLAEAGEVTAIDSHPLLTRLARPNQDWGGRRLILATETSLCLAGEAFWHFPHNQGAKPAGIDYLAHTRVAVVKPGADDPKHRTVAGWKIDPSTAAEKSARPDEMLRLAYFDPEDPDYGALAPAAVAALGSDAYHAAMRSNSDIFAKGMRGKGLVTPPEEMESFGWEQMDEVQARFDKHLRGTGNNHNLVVMPYRYGVQRLDVSAKDAEFLGLLEFSIEDVARAFFIPIEMVGGTRRTYQNNEAADRALWERCLGPESSWIADELTARLCPAWGLDDSYFIGFDLCDVVALQDDESLKWARDREEIAAGTKTQNEYRSEVGRDPVPWGDAWWGPPGLAPVGETVPATDEPAEVVDDEPTDDDTRAALTRAIAAAMVGENSGLRYSEDQPRDDDGKFGSGGGGGSDSGGSGVSNEAADSWGDKSYGAYTESLPPSQAEALARYKVSAYHAVNETLRHGGQTEETTSPEDVKEIIGTMDKVIDNAPRVESDISVFRGIDGDTVAALGGLGEGAEIADKGFVSTSLNTEAASVFASSDNPGSHFIRIKVPKGARGIYADTTHMQKTERTHNEREFILPRGSRFRVTRRSGTLINKYGEAIPVIDAELVV